MLVHKGIKHARTGFDDVDFVSLHDCAEEMVDTRPASAMRKASSSGSLRPASAAGSASRGAAASPAESIESIESAESGRVVYRPGSAGSGGQRRPGTATSGGSGRRPTTASMSVRQGSGAARPRPGTSSMRPRTAALGFGARPGTGGGLRPGTAASSRPSTAGGGTMHGPSGAARALPRAASTKMIRLERWHPTSRTDLRRCTAGIWRGGFGGAMSRKWPRSTTERRRYSWN